MIDYTYENGTVCRNIVYAQEVRQFCLDLL